MKSKGRLLLLLYMMIILVVCTSHRESKQVQEFQEYLANMVNIMTFDQAVKTWGEPSSITEEDEILIAVWGGNRTKDTTKPLGYYNEDIHSLVYRHGYTLTLFFNKATKKMAKWKFKTW